MRRSCVTKSTRTPLIVSATPARPLIQTLTRKRVCSILCMEDYMSINRASPPWSIHPRSGMILLVLLFFALIFLDYRAGPGFSLRLFYLVPTALAAWVLGLRAGIMVAIGAAALC